MKAFTFYIQEKRNLALEVNVIVGIMSNNLNNDKKAAYAIQASRKTQNK